jgi:hypothetical protein
MKLHSNILTEADVREALSRAKRRGNVDRLIDFSELSARGSRSRKNGFEVRLEWLGTKVKGDGRRWTNTGSYGADTGGAYAATRDEWGWFIAELFQMDEHAIFGYYEGMDNFDTSTRHAYVIENPLAV